VCLGRELRQVDRLILLLDYVASHYVDYVDYVVLTCWFAPPRSCGVRRFVTPGLIED
jgi:hypothetical protein